MPVAILGLIIGYLLGSIPTAYIVSRIRRGIEFDIAKGAAAILIAQALSVSELWIFGAGFAAVLGHNFPVFTGFRGGQGSATVIGIFLVLAPTAALVTLAVVAIPFFATRKFAGAIIIGFALLPLFIWLLEGSSSLVCYALAIDVFMLIRNLPDIRRLLAKGIVKDMIHDRHRKKTR
jgi:glycerol-3-phosphate acyltransferase PlsY